MGVDYCASNDETVINEGLQTVKRVLAENYVRPDEAEKVKSTIRERGSLKIIDKVTVTLNEKRDVYEALLGNLGVSKIEVPSSIVKKFEKLLVGGIWCIATLEYFYEEDQKGSPFLLRDLKPIQMPNMDMDELFQGRRGFTEQQWIDVLLRSTGMEPTNFQERVKWHLLARMIPLVENNYNLAELGPRGTGKSHIYKEISPNSILVSGGQTTVARRWSCWLPYFVSLPQEDIFYMDGTPESTDRKTVFEFAKLYVAGGISIIPIKLDGSKAPAVALWKPYQTRIATDDELRHWFLGSDHGIGICCGAVSGGLEVIDLDDGTLFEPWRLLVPDIVAALTIVQTPSDGWHVIYRCDQIGGNAKIAMDPNREKKTLIETRGDGHKSAVARSVGICWMTRIAPRSKSP